MTVFLLFSWFAAAIAPAATVEGPWTLLETGEVAKVRAEGRIDLREHQPLKLDIDLFRLDAEHAPLESAKGTGRVIELPNPNGKMQRFEIVESPIMDPELAAMYPEIKTWCGTGLDDPQATLRLDTTLEGLHAQVITPAGTWYIDPIYFGDPVDHASYYRTQLRKRQDWHCGVTEEAMTKRAERVASRGVTKNNGETLRTFRLAMAATGEYTQFHGGTVPSAMSAIVTTMNRVNGIYEREVAVRMVLIANTNLLIYTDPGTDPYTNDDGNAMLGQNQTNITNVIGNANYDIGHVFSTGGGGIAALGSVCSIGSKAQGVTGSSSPVGDPFDVDYVAHEMGHQFDAPHTFNGSDGNCGGNRSSSDAFEPGSGSTIMAYAGICGIDDLQANSDPWFHSASLEDITDFLNSNFGATCAVDTATGNQIPTVNAGGDYTIPKGTPFTLTASGNDPDSDPLIYSWEQRDLGPSQNLPDADNGMSPLFRFFPPTASPSRTFPRLSNILNGVLTNDEKLPQLSRTMDFIVVARDNKAGGGAFRTDTAVVEVADSAGPFVVTQPTGSATASGLLSVTWDVANTNLAPVNTTLVNIELSTDSGQTFTTMLAANTPNDGVEVVTLPALSSPVSTARVRVSAVNNIYFNISQGDFQINPAQLLTLTGEQMLSDGDMDGRVKPGETGVELFLRVVNVSTTETASNITATITPQVGTVTATINSSTYANLTPGQSGYNLSPFVLDIDENHPCGESIPFEINLIANGGAFDQTFVFAVAVQTPTLIELGTVTQTATGLPLAIPDQGTITSSISITSSLNVTQVRVLNVDINHTWSSDLDITLISPEGTRVLLASDLGSDTDDAYAGTTFDDEADTLISEVGPPFTATYRPLSPLSAMIGESAQGTWTLEVTDALDLDVGSLQGWGLELRVGEVICGPPPARARHAGSYE